MKLSSKTHYGLIACHILGKNYPDTPVSSTMLEKHISVSSKYLEKILRTLSKRQIVKANRGALGGYMLAKSPEEITIGEIVRALEDDIILIECVKKDAKCKCCPTSIVWEKLYQAINEQLDKMTLAQMLTGQLRKGETDVE